MKTVALTRKQFLTKFRTESQCVEYLFSLKFLNGFSCRKCQNNRYIALKKRTLLEFLNCGYQESPKSGTVFHGSKVSLKNWFQTIFEFIIGKGGIAATELQERLCLGSYRTAWGMLNKIRKSMKSKIAGGTGERFN